MVLFVWLNQIVIQDIFSLIEIMIGYGCITLFIGCISHPIIGFLPCFANIIIVCIFTRQEICVIGYTRGVIDGGFFVSPSMEIMLGQCFVDIIQLQISVCLTFYFLDRTTSFFSVAILRFVCWAYSDADNPILSSS